MELNADGMPVYVLELISTAFRLFFFFKQSMVNRLALQTAQDEVKQSNGLSGVLEEHSFAIWGSYLKPCI